MLAHAEDSEKGLKRTLGAGHLVALGIGAIIGAGLFVRTAAAAGQAAGPGVTLSFVVAAIGCAFAGLCYAEFASMIPIAGSAYAYSYVTMGELIAWIIGWALIMEYALGAATVSIAWSEYLNKLLGGAIPYEWCHSPFESFVDKNGLLHSGIMNAPALVILLVLTLLLIRGTQESAFVNAIIVFIKVAIVLLFIAIGWQFINSGNHTPYLIPEGTPPVINLAPKTVGDSSFVHMLYGKGLIHDQFNILVQHDSLWINKVLQKPDLLQTYNPIMGDSSHIIKGNVVASYEGWNKHGWGGVLGGAAIVFFAFIGFDAVSTAAQEAKNPKRDMPIGIMGSLIVCTILYILFGHVLTGVANWKDFVDPEKGREASVAYAITTYMHGYGWLATAVTVAILAGFSSVILVMLMGQSRIFYTMSNDGLIPKAFGVLHPKYKTPYKSNLILFVFVGAFAAFVPGHVAGDLTSFGTLFAFVLVSIGVWILRVKSPNLERPFRTPLYPVVSTLGALICLAMIVGLDAQTLKVAFIWMAIGLVIYFTYSRSRSKLKSPGEILPKASDFN